AVYRSCSCFWVAQRRGPQHARFGVMAWSGLPLLLLFLGGAAVYRSCSGLWVAQRFTAAIAAASSVSALAAEGATVHHSAPLREHRCIKGSGRSSRDIGGLVVQGRQLAVGLDNLGGFGRVFLAH